MICSGVFEYIRKPEEFLRRIPRLGRTMIISYCPAVDGQSRLHRLSVNWVNHFSRPAFEELLDRMGLDWEAVYTDEQAETIYKARLSPTS